MSENIQSVIGILTNLLQKIEYEKTKVKEIRNDIEVAIDELTQFNQ